MDNGLTYTGILKLFASATAVAVFLLAFGFFSDAALFQMVGMPQLSADYLQLVESGARQLIDSLSALGITRGFIGLFLIALWGAAWSLRDRKHMWRFSRWPTLHLMCQGLLLVLLVVLLSALVSTAEMASPQGADILERKIEKARADVLASDDWSPSKELDEIEQQTFDSAAPFSHLPDMNQDSDGEDGNLEKYTHNDPSLGFAVRATEKGRRQARSAYGWLFFFSLLSVLGVLALRRWRVWLASDDRYLTQVGEVLGRNRSAMQSRSEPGPGGSFTRELYGPYLQTSQRLAEPLLIVLSAVVVALLPIAHGALARETIGLQPVMVQLRNVDSSGNVCAPDPSAHWIGPDWWKEKVVRLNENNDFAVPVEKPNVSSTRRICDKNTLEQLDKRLVGFRSAWKRVILKRPIESEFDGAKNFYTQQVDDVFRFLRLHKCPAAIAKVWQVRPSKGEFEARPELSEYFWNRWTEFRNENSSIRVGWLLRNPRGSEADRLSLFEVLERKPASRAPRVSLQTVWRKCVAHLEPIRNPIQDHVARISAIVESDPLSERLPELELYPSIHAAQAALSLAENDSISVPRREALLTTIGSLGQVIGSDDADFVEALVNYLADVVSVGLNANASDQAIANAGTAATALHNVRGGWSAIKVAELIEESDIASDPARLEEIGSLVTSAGFLANDVNRTIAEHSLQAGPLLTSVERIDHFLNSIASDPNHRPSVRRSACTSLGLSGTLGALESISDVVKLEVGKPRGQQDLAFLESCLAQFPATVTTEQRDLLRNIAVNHFNADVQKLAFGELYEAGLYTEAETVFQKFENPETRSDIAIYLEDVRPSVIGDILLRNAERCASDLCTLKSGDALFALSLLDANRTKGDDGLSERMAQFLDNPELALDACHSLNEFAARQGRDARRIIQASPNCELDDQLEADPRDRWSSNVVRFAAAGIRESETSKDKEIVPVRIPLKLGETVEIDQSATLFFFEIEVEESGSFEFFTIAPNPNTDTVFFLENANGDVIAFDDDGGEGLNARIEQNLEAGSYILILGSATDSGPDMRGVVVISGRLDQPDSVL